MKKCFVLLFVCLVRLYEKKTCNVFLLLMRFFVDNLNVSYEELDKIALKSLSFIFWICFFLLVSLKKSSLCVCVFWRIYFSRKNFL